MSIQYSDRRRRRTAFLLSALVLVGLVITAVAIIPMFAGQPLRAEPGGPPTDRGSAPATSKATASPTATAKDKPTGKATDKATKKPTTKATAKVTKQPTAKATAKVAKKPTAKATDGATKKPADKVETAKPYNGSGKVPAVKSERRTMDKSTATKVVGTYVKAVPKIDPETKKVKDVVGDIAGTAVQQELVNQLAELNANGWTLSGEPVVKSATVVAKDLKASPPTVTVKACVDSSKVVTLDSEGKKVGSVAPAPPAYNIYELHQLADGSWQLVSHSFPDNPSC